MPATDSTTTMTPTMSAMLTALSADRGASVTELSKRAELGRSTAARVLTALEGMGRARRERPDRSTDHSSPDLWFTTAADQFEPDVAGEQSADRLPETEPDTHSSEIPAQAEVDDPQPTANNEPEHAAEAANVHDSEGSDDPTPQAQQEAEPDVAFNGETPAVQPDPEPVGDPAPAADDVAANPAPVQEAQAQSAAGDAPELDADTKPDSGSGTGAADTGNTDGAAPSGTGATVRLGKGELRAMVFEHLKAHPDEDFTASQVGKALNKSSGAVANNFDALAKTGDAQLTCEKPRKFRFLAKAAN
jgi:hypothetical protein